MKKMRNSQIDPDDGARVTTQEIGRRSKVKFVADSENDSPRLERDYSHMPSERRKVTAGADMDPKTSEYAFFKKLKKDASLRSNAHPLRKDASGLSSKKPRSSDYSRERTSDVRVASKVFDPSKIVEDMSAVKTGSFHSPSGGAWHKSDIYSFRSTPKSNQGCSDTFKPQGNQYANGEIFSRKRQKLQQCIADVLFPDIEKMSSKGYDILSMLVSRLFPMSTEENQKSEDPNRGKVENDTRYDLLDSPEPDFEFKEDYHIPKRKLLDFESSSHFNDRLLVSSDETTTPHSEFPTNHSFSFQPLYNIAEPECNLSRTPSFSSTSKSDICLGYQSKEVANATTYGLLDSHELDVKFTEHHQIPRRDLLERELSSSFSDHLLSPMFLPSVELITPCANIELITPCDKVANATTYGVLDSQELDVKFTEHHQIPRRDLLELEPRLSFSNHLSSPMFLPSVELITPRAGIATCSHMFPPLFSVTENESKLDETTIFIDKKYVTHGFLCDEQKHETFKWNHFKELGKLERQPIPLLLEKDYDCTTDKGKEQILNNTLDEYHSSPSPLLLLDKPRDFNSTLDSGLLKYQEFRFGKSVHEDMHTNCNLTTLSLSHYKHHFNLSENVENDGSCVEDSMFLSPHQQRVGRTVSSDHHHHHPETEAMLPPILDECQRFLSLTNSHSSYHSSNSRPLLLPQMETMSSPFQIVDNYKPEMDLGNHGEVLYHFRKDLIGMYDASFLRMSVQRDIGCQLSSLDENDYINEQEQTHKMLL